MRRSFPTAAQGARLAARPRTAGRDGPAGRHLLGLDRRRDALIEVPRGYRPGAPAALAVMLHGAGGDAEGGMGILGPLAEEAGIIVLAPPSRGGTWDVIRGAYGPDVAFIDQALAWTFERYDVDPARVCLGGFSDGASYALALGITNGALFTHLAAYSPGFLAPADMAGEPRVFISHGTRDAVLPIDRCSRVVVPRLVDAGYDVVYREFEGGHTVPRGIARESVEWLSAG